MQINVVVRGQAPPCILQTSRIAGNARPNITTSFYREPIRNGVCLCSIDRFSKVEWPQMSGVTVMSLFDALQMIVSECHRATERNVYRNMFVRDCINSPLLFLGHGLRI